jgi:hypothetical protein
MSPLVPAIIGARAPAMIVPTPMLLNAVARSCVRAFLTVMLAITQPPQCISTHIAADTNPHANMAPAQNAISRDNPGARRVIRPAPY